MSWLSDKTGRPEEEGGHSRIDISANLYTREVLEKVDNKSNFVEYCISAFTQPKWIAYQNPEATVNGNSRKFRSGAVFKFCPKFSPGNAILRLNCFFDYCSEGSDVLFRVTVNGEVGLELVARSASNYACSHVYSERELGFQPRDGIFRSRDSYVFKFQFRPTDQDSEVEVRDIHLYIQVIESPLLSDLDQFLSFLRKPK